MGRGQTQEQGMMSAVTVEEVASLQREFDWVLNVEVDTVLSQLKAAVKECAGKFPISVGETNTERAPQSDKFVLTNSDQLKVIVTLTGDTISAADINLKLPRPHTKDAYHNTQVREDIPWMLQQVQDSANHLLMSMDSLQTLPQDDSDANFDDQAGRMIRIERGCDQD